MQQKELISTPSPPGRARVLPRNLRRDLPPFHRKLNTANPVWADHRVGGVALKNSLLVHFPNTHGTQKHLKMGSNDKSDSQKHRTKTDRLCFALLQEGGDGLPWERTGLNFDQERCLWTLGTDPTPGNLRRWILEMSFRTSSHRLRLGVIRCGWNTLPNCCSELRVWPELWTPWTRSCTDAEWCSQWCLLLD